MIFLIIPIAILFAQFGLPLLYVLLMSIYSRKRPTLAITQKAIEYWLYIPEFWQVVLYFGMSFLFLAIWQYVLGYDLL